MGVDSQWLFIIHKTHHTTLCFDHASSSAWCDIYSSPANSICLFNIKIRVLRSMASEPNLPHLTPPLVLSTQFYQNSVLPIWFCIVDSCSATTKQSSVLETKTTWHTKTKIFLLSDPLQKILANSWRESLIFSTLPFLPTKILFHYSLSCSLTSC